MGLHIRAEGRSFVVIASFRMYRRRDSKSTCILNDGWNSGGGRKDWDGMGIACHGVVEHHDVLMGLFSLEP